MASAPDAQAQSYRCCEHSAEVVELNDGSVSATVNVSKNCSDGLSRFDGVVRDIRCDARSAYLEMWFYNRDNPINNSIDFELVEYRSEKPSAGNGCGSESTFNYSSTNPDPIIYACAYATNWAPAQSKGDCEYF